jgi:hypothetical protein
VITKAQAQDYIDGALGISVPSFILAAAIEAVEACEPAMADAGYSDAKQTLVQSMAVALVAAKGSPRRIASQAAPSGASRSFFNDKDALSRLHRALAAEDTAGTVTQVVGPDPAAATMLMVVC